MTDKPTLLHPPQRHSQDMDQYMQMSMIHDDEGPWVSYAAYEALWQRFMALSACDDDNTAIIVRLEQELQELRNRDKAFTDAVARNTENPDYKKNGPW